MSPTPLYETIAGVVTGIFEPAINFIDELHLSEEEKAKMQNILDQARLEIMEKQLETQAREAEAKAKEAEAEAAAVMALAKVAEAEATGDSWLQRNWRPALMAVIISMLINNFIAYPYLSAIWPAIKQTPIPTACWAMLTGASGTYIFGRSWEKGGKIKNTFSKVVPKITTRIV